MKWWWKILLVLLLIVVVVFLLKKVYSPDYLKWVLREFFKLPDLAAEIGPTLENAMVYADCGDVVESLYRVLDMIIEFQKMGESGQ